MRIYVIYRRMLYYLLILTLLVSVLVLIYIYFIEQSSNTAKLVMGAQLISPNHEPLGEYEASPKTDQEKYFRPSKLPIINNRNIGHDFLHDFEGQKPQDIKIPISYYTSPQDTIINYFSIIRDAANLIEGKITGCGTVGSAKLPFPIAYTYFSPEYQKRVDYDEYLKSFEGIGHTNLIKLKELPPDQIHPEDMRYFIEIETLEGSDKGITYFAYYYGYVYIEKHGSRYLISDIQLLGEDFLCAPYHGWYHDAEYNVTIRYGNWCKMIEKQYPTQLDGYTKKIPFKGTDGNDYLIEFMQLTNDTDIEVAQYKKLPNGQWKVVYLHPEKCVEEKQ